MHSDCGNIVYCFDQKIVAISRDTVDVPICRSDHLDDKVRAIQSDAIYLYVWTLFLFVLDVTVVILIVPTQ